MSLQLCLLETGETVIADIREAIDPDSNKSLGYLVTNPFAVEHTIHNTVQVDENFDKVDSSPEGSASLSYRIWAPLSRQNVFNFHTDFVRVIYEPDSKITEQYTAVLAKWQKEHTLTVEVDKHSTNVSWASDKNIASELEEMNPSGVQATATGEDGALNATLEGNTHE
jgi:hypothetical protein